MGGMTLHASRTGQQITVHSTYGPAKHEITEEAGHVRSFHTQLGSLLDDADAEREAARKAELEAQEAQD